MVFKRKHTNVEINLYVLLFMRVSELKSVCVCVGNTFKAMQMKTI